MAGIANTSKHQALVIQLLDDLGKLMWAMVWDVANHDRWQLAPEEVHAELCLEMVKVVRRYHSKPYEELKKLCVVCMRNRVHDLATACYLTARKAEAKMISIDNPLAKWDTDSNLSDSDGEVDGVDTFHVLHGGGVVQDIIFDIDDYTDGMSDDAKALVREVLNPSERTIYFLALSEQRKRFASPKGFWTMTITPAIMVRSMGWTWDRLRAAWSEVSCAVGGADFDSGLVAKEER